MMEPAEGSSRDHHPAPAALTGESVFPASFAQARLWFLDQLEPGSPLYNLPATTRARGPLDAPLLERCLAEIVRRHEALRTTFRAQDGQPVQVIAPSLRIPLPVVDLTASPDPQAEARCLAAEEARLPFDLARGPLLRARVLRLPADEWILLVTLHHIVADGWSLGVFFRELSLLHDAFREGLPSPLPELPIQVADFAVWQRETLRGEALEKLLEHWRARLRGAPALLALPTDHPRPPVRSSRGASHVFLLSTEIQDAVRALGRSLSATPFMILLAAYAVLLSRRARQADMVIGAPVANRPRAELEGLIGFFVNLLALRLDLDGAPTFRELCLRVREITLDAYAHQDLPFERLVEDLAPERDLSHGPLVQVTFGLHNTPLASSGVAEDPADGPPPLGAETAKFDLSLVMMESPRGLLATFEYDRDLFEAATVERMAGELRLLLAAALADPGRRITELPWITPEERARLLALGNDTGSPSAEDRGVHRLVAEHAARAPEAEAVICDAEVLTYRALVARASQLAHHLQSLGVGPEVKVGLCLPRSARAITAMLGVLVAGGAYVPLDPAYPRERLAFMIEDAAVPVLLTETALARTLPATGARVVCLDALEEILAALPEEPPPSAVTGRDLAYVIYTSGSTGRPKGVLVEHRGLANLPAAQAPLYGVGPGDRVLQLAPLGFDTSVCEIWTALTAGAALVVAEGDDHLPGLLRLIRAQRVSTVIIPPSVLAALPAEESASLPIRLLALVGEACPADLVRRWVAPGRRIVNSYGPTEATIWATSAVDLDGSRPPPIGAPIANTRVYLLDEAREPVPPGVAGEIYIGGVGVARGYHARPDLTAERFLPDPFGPDPRGRIYRTGDLARRLPDGSLVFVGRVDDQIKLRGNRVEVGEIEAVLAEHPAVKAAAVVCREPSPGRRELCACVVPDPAFAAPGERRAALRAELHGEWRAIFDEAYREVRPEPAGILDTVGWKSSYTGAPFPAEEMEAWADAAAARVLALRPARVLEVGCGAGLVLHRVAPHVERYVGLDFSAVALEQLASEVRARGLAAVHLEARDAAELAGLGERGFDVVVLSSVAQYFPSLEFLLDVLRAATTLLADRGAIFLGDVRSLSHLALQHASVEIFRAAPGTARAEIRAAAARKRALEQELCLHPALFLGLSERIEGIAEAQVLLRRGRHRNEMTKFHHDVILRKGAPIAAPITPARLSGRDLQEPLAAVRAALAGAPEALLVTDLEDARLASELRGLAWLDAVRDDRELSALRAEIAASPPCGVDPEDLADLAASLGYTVSPAVSASEPVGRFDALLLRRGVEGPVAGFPRPIAPAPLTLANDPIAGRLERALVQSLRAHLEERLPSYMIPAAFVLLDELPRSPHGKIDRAALAERGRVAVAAPGLSGSDALYRAPRDAVERALSEVWASVLGLPRVGIHDNFFEIGGDSILAIQIVSRAGERGIALTPRQMFQHQTIAGLAVIAGAAKAGAPGEGPVTGEAPLTPVQRWWLDQEPAEPHHFNQSMLLAAREPLDPAALERALAAVIEHHDALRLRLAGDGAETRLRFAAPGGPLPFARVDLSSVPEPERGAALARAAAEAQASLDLREGPVLRVVLFERGAEADARLLLVVHHLAVDAVSWKILLADLWTAYEAARRGVPPALPPRTTSWKRWAELQAERAGTEAAAAELHHWLAPAFRAAAPLPVDHDTGPDDGASARHVVVSLAPEDTERLLREAPAAYRARLDELLLAAFAWALGRWTGSPAVLFDLEGHGREELFPGVDLTRTVGWFTTLHPVAVEIGGRAPEEAVALVQRVLAATPHRGLGYGLLRRLRPDTRAALAALPAAQICWNYLGQLDRALPAAAPLAPAPEPAGPDRSPAARRTHLVEVNAWIAAGSLHVAWTYSEHRHRRATLEGVAASFLSAVRAVLARARPAPAEAGIEDRYPLTPLQEGILFHARSAPSDPVYLVQTAWTMEGAVDARTFAAALQDLVDRHAALRTSFAWEGLAAPEQRVHAPVALPVEEVDLRALGPEERSRAVARREEEDRARGFDPTRAPLMRVTLLRLRDDALRVVWTLHHVLLDGWSMPILLDELFALHDARRRGRAAALDPPPAFRAYVAWLGQQDRARSASFWRRELAGFVAPTPLGVDRPAPRDDGGPRAGWQRLSLGAGPTEALLAFAQRSKLTPSTVVQGAWALLLARYGGEEDVVFGAAVSGRSAPIPGIWRMVGLLINTLPVRVRTPWDAPVERWLAELQAHLAELREHEHSALVEVMAESDLPRGAPLFESLVVFENYPVQASPHASAGGVPARGEGGLAITDAGHFDDAPYPLTLLAAHRGVLHLELGYDRRRVDDEVAARVVRHLATLLAAIAESAGATLGDLSLLGAEERRDLLAAGNDTAADYPREACLHELFAARAEASPDAPALLFEGRVVRYRELADRAQSVARRLRALGVGRGARVGVCAERSPEAVAAILGALAAGAAYVPLDPGYPRDRLAFMIEDARLEVVLAGASAPLSGIAVRVEPIEAEAASEGELPPAGITSAEAAYVIYTSGSTGRPKGVVGTHRGLVNRCAWMWRSHPFQPGEVCCHKTSLGFVDSLWEIFGPLLHGVPALILPDDRVRDLPRLLAALGDARVTRLVLVPSLLAALLDVAPDLGARLPDLAIVTSSGEALSAELAARFHRAMPGRRLLNIYGSSEVAADATCAEVPADLAGGVTIGTPLANTRAHVLDAALHPAPIGAPGELFIGGDGLALGYLDRPDLTAQRFVRDPFSADPAARLFRTGDRARRRADGELELLGRRDDQVKVRGVRVELGDVRAALLDHPAVREAAVAARADERGELRLVAYVVPREDAEAQPAALGAFLRDRLPAAMVPSAFVHLAALPLLPNGKLDRRALPAPEAPAGAAGHMAPRDALEAQIAAVWAEVLGVDRVSVSANFFDLGGHSLLLARVHDRLVARFARPITLVDMLAHPTVASLARLLGAPAEEHRASSAAEERARRQRAARKGRGGDRG